MLQQQRDGSGMTQQTSGEIMKPPLPVLHPKPRDWDAFEAGMPQGRRGQVHRSSVSLGEVTSGDVTLQQTHSRRQDLQRGK
jgi:hypothetical protein